MLNIFIIRTKMEKFDELYGNFLTYLTNAEPGLRKYIKSPKEATPTQPYLLDFVEFNLPYIESISTRDKDAFFYKHLDAQLVRGIKFRHVLKKINPNFESEIWRYLHRLYLLSYNSCELKKVLKMRYPAMLDLVKDNATLVENMMASETPVLKPPVSLRPYHEKDDISSSSSEEDDNGGLPTLLSLANSALDITSRGKTFSQALTEIENCRNTLPVETSPQPEQPKQTQQNHPNPLGMFEGTFIGDLAKEITQEISPEELEKIQNPQELIATLFSPDGKLNNIMQKIGTKVQEKVQKGELNQEVLMQEMGKMVGGLDIGKMMQQVGMMEGLMGGGNKKKKRRGGKRG